MIHQKHLEIKSFTFWSVPPSDYDKNTFIAFFFPEVEIHSG